MFSAEFRAQRGQSAADSQFNPSLTGGPNFSWKRGGLPTSKSISPPIKIARPHNKWVTTIMCSQRRSRYLTAGDSQPSFN